MKADRDLKLYGKCIYLFNDDPETLKAAEKVVREHVLAFLESEKVLNIITHTQGDVSPDGFPIIPELPSVKAVVAWKLDMNPLLKEPDTNEQPVKPLTEFLNWLGVELRNSVDAVFERSRKHTTTISEIYANTVDAINTVIDKKIERNRGRTIR